MRNEGKCRLCSELAKLCNSHIIPEFFYEQMQLYDEKHRFNVLPTGPGKHHPSEQKGFREKLLCKKCEVKLSQWENYARTVLYGGKCIEININNAKGVECTVDYKKFKLFQISILWRIGVNTLKEFSSIYLGEHEVVLRKMLFEEKPVNAEAYGCVIIYSTTRTEITSNVIHCMGMSVVEGVSVARLLLGGFFWVFFLSEKAKHPFPKKLFLQESGYLRILITDKDPNRYIELLAKDIYNANPRRFNQLHK